MEYTLIRELKIYKYELIIVNTKFKTIELCDTYDLMEYFERCKMDVNTVILSYDLIHNYMDYNIIQAFDSIREELDLQDIPVDVYLENIKMYNEINGRLKEYHLANDTLKYLQNMPKDLLDTNYTIKSEIQDCKDVVNFTEIEIDDILSNMGYYGIDCLMY